MSTQHGEDSSNKNKRGGGILTKEDDETTKRQRRSVVAEDEVQALNQDEDAVAAAAAAAAPKEEDDLTMLKRLEKDIVAGMEAKQQQAAEIQRQVAQMERQLEKVRARIVSVAEQPAWEERRARRAANPRIEQALGIYETGSVPLDELLEQQFPDFVDNLDFWWALLDRKCCLPLDPKVYDILRKRRPPTVLNNKQLLLRLLAYDPWIYGVIPTTGWRLTEDADIVEVVLKFHPYKVAAIARPVQLQYPRLVGVALARLCLRNEACSTVIERAIDSGAWRNRDIVLGWVKGGGELHNHIPQNLREDQEILLTAIGNKATSRHIPPIPDQFKGDIEFMKKAAGKNPFVLGRVAENLRGNKDLALSALSGPYGNLAPFAFFSGFLPDDEGTHASRIHRFWLDVGEKIRQQLRTHDAFVELVLGSIHFSVSKPSNLAIIDHGGEATVLARMKLVAEYAGVPTGENLKKLRVARKNLAMAGICWSD